MKQTVTEGPGTLTRLDELLKTLDAKNIFLVKGESSYTNSGAEKIIEELLSKYPVSFFSEFTVNPKLEDVIKGMESLLETQCDTVLAIGGGSVIDMAKAVNILSCQDSKPDLILRGDEKILNKGKNLIAVPTTSGAGSEATHFAVVYSGNEKYSLADEKILPDFAIIDPELTYTLPKNITAVSGMDAFSQALESYWNVNANAESKKYSLEAIRLIFGNLSEAVNNPSDESRINMSKAAHLSGKAINITKTTAPHAVSYILTSHFGIPHGQAVCITLGEFLEFNYNVSAVNTNGNKTPEEIKNNLDELISLSGCGDIKEFRKKIRELILSTGLQTRLSNMNIKEEDIDFITVNVNTERLKNNPRIVHKDDIKNILRSII